MVPGHFAGLADPDDAGHVFRPRTAPPFLVTAHHERFELGSLANVKHADALGPMKFVPGHGQQIHPGGGHVDGDFPHGLHRIGVKNNSARADFLGQLRNGVDDAGLVVGPHDTDHSRIVAQALQERILIQAPLTVHRDESHPVAIIAVLFEQVFDGRVFHPSGDDVALVRLGLQGGVDGRGIAFRTAAGKQDLIGAGADQGRHLIPGPTDIDDQPAAEAVHAGGVAVAFGEIGQHGLHHLGGHFGGGIVIHIDRFHRRTSSTTSSGVTSSRSLASTTFFSVTWEALQPAHVPRSLTMTRSPSTSTSSISPPS